MPAYLFVGKSYGIPVSWMWRTERPCPICGSPDGHLHGGGTITTDPRFYLGARQAHCKDYPEVVYFLTDADPAATAATKAKARADLAAALKANDPRARRTVKEATAINAARRRATLEARRQAANATPPTIALRTSTKIERCS